MLWIVNSGENLNEQIMIVKPVVAYPKRHLISEFVPGDLCFKSFIEFVAIF